MEEKRPLFGRHDDKHDDAKEAKEAKKPVSNGNDKQEKKPEPTLGQQPVQRSSQTMSLTIPNVTMEQANAIASQLHGQPIPPPEPSPGSLAAIQAAPSNWAAYTFCNSEEWAALDAAYGVPAVNEMKNYYQGPYRMPGLVNPGDPNTALREIGAPGPFRYYVMLNGQQSEDTGQADELQVHITGKAQPKLPIRP